MSVEQAVSAWVQIKRELRRRLGAREWEMWISHARLVRVMGDCLLVSLPPRGIRTWGAQRHRDRMTRMAQKRGLGGVLLTVHADEWQQDQLMQRSGWEWKFIDPEVV